MKRHPLVSVYLLILVFALPAAAADRADEVRATEIAFAKAFADRDVKKFFSYRAPIIMRARDRTIIEVSEWKSQEAIDAAHKNLNVLAMWKKFFAICDCVPFKTLAEAKEMFPNFEPL